MENNVSGCSTFCSCLLMENNIFPFGQGKKASKVPGQYDDVLPFFFFLVTMQITEMNRYQIVVAQLAVQTEFVGRAFGFDPH